MTRFFGAVFVGLVALTTVPFALGQTDLPRVEGLSWDLSGFRVPGQVPGQVPGSGTA